MSATLKSFLLQRLIYPAIIVACILIRPVLMSVSYAVLLIWLPHVPLPQDNQLTRHTLAFLLVAIIASACNVLLHIVANVVMSEIVLTHRCDLTEYIMLHVGVIRVEAFRYIELVWLAPDALMLLTSVAMFLLLRSRSRPSKIDFPSVPKTRHFSQSGAIQLLLSTPYLALAALFASAAIQPSIPGAFYFAMFLGSATWWSLNLRFGQPFVWMCRICTVYYTVNILLLLAYQTPYAQAQFPATSLPIRLLGLNDYLHVACIAAPGANLSMSFNWQLSVVSWLNPIVLMSSQFLVVLVAGAFGQRLMASADRRKSRRKSRRDRRPSTPRPDPAENPPPVPPQPPPAVGYVAQLIAFAGHCTEWLLKHCGILSNIVLMVWSIVYHGWLTFVLLLWANVLWVLPNQRKHMMLSSPFIVAYAELLLWLQYAYGLNFANEELPAGWRALVTDGQLGLIRSALYPVRSITLMVLFATGFWMTLRRHRHEQARSGKEAAATDVLSMWTISLGSLARRLLLQLWIWLVLGFLLAIAIYGEKITAIQIVYMALFLGCLITYQLSTRVWIRVMYTFWLVVIGYSMFTLLLYYTYQFNGCDVLWTELFGLTISMQHDIGLDVFKTKDLFLHLLYPTVVVIMAVAQIQIFHGKYVALMSFDYYDSKSFRELNNESGLFTPDEPIENKIRSSIESKTARLTLRFIRFSHFTHINLSTVKCKIAELYSQLKSLVDIGMLLFEKHLVKVLCMYSFYIALCDVCVVHLYIAVLAVVAAVCRTAVQIKLCSLISISIGVLLIVRMSYQFETVKESWGHTNCSVSQNVPATATYNRIENNVHWIGMIKATKAKTFKSLISPYMVFLMLVTFFKFVRIQQQRKRFEKGLPITIPKLIFADINRDRADKGLRYMLKYLVNYFLYKFGIEITFVASVVLIGYRMNMIALIYAVWLVALFVSGERFRRAVWPYFRSSIVLLIVVQYAIVVGLPPFLCFSMFDRQPIVTPLWRAFNFWAWLPDVNLDRLAPELMFDYLLLFAVSRQQRVFQLETHYARLNRDYPGGNNRSVIDEIDQQQPIPEYQAHDFVTFVYTWLDIVKSVLFIGFYWLSLAIVFLAGTNRVNIFSIGYLCGSFIFLWQGTDFYLRPINQIRRCWQYLIGYNLFVICTKVVMQVPNCIFAPHMAELCWLVQLIGISCKQSWFAIAGQAQATENVCFQAQETVSLTWDEICFVVLIVQLRIFSSYYFCHVFREIKAVTDLSSRGADLIESLRVIEVGVKAQHESEIISKIQRKMTLIKEKQPNRREPVSHFEALYSGDYALFDETMGNRVTVQESSSVSSASNSMQDKATNTETSLDQTVSTAKSAKHSVVIAFFKGLLLCITLRLYMLSRHYRYVMRILDKDKKRLKTADDFGQQQNVASAPQIRTEQSLQPDEFYMRKHSTLFEFVISLWYTIFANTEMLCYLSVILNMIVSANLLTMPLALMVLLWGTLSVGRPSKTFWVTMIAYVQVMLLVKCVCQLDMAWWNRYPMPAATPMAAPVIIGIEKKDKYAAYDLLVLLAVFFHRFVLKQMGVWQSFRDEQRIAGLYAAVAEPVGIDLRGFQLADNRRLQLHNEERQLMRPAPRRISVDIGSEDSIRPNAKETYRLLDVKLEVVSSHGVQVVVAQQDDLKLTLTKVSINDERPGNEQMVHISNYSLDAGSYFPSVARLSCIKYASSFVCFLRKFRHQANQVPVDVYLYIFVCDFINFFVILFGSESFSYNEGQGSGIAYYVQHNQVPIAYLSTLLMQFVCIMIDRALYLRKNLSGKLIFHVLSVILVHIWLFLVVPKFTKQSFNAQPAPILFYIVKCVYFLFSAHQIRRGYPLRLMGNRMTNSYSVINLALFKIYMLIPFLFELRALMDWMWTESSMSLPQWLKMEDIFANTFWIKCMRQFDKDFPDQRGMSKKKIGKYLMGGAVLLGIVAIVWGPLTLFAFEASSSSRILPTNVRMELQIGAYETLYSADANKIEVMPENRFNNVLAKLNPYAQSTSDLQAFSKDGISEISFGQSADVPWLISPKGITSLLAEMRSTEPPPIVMVISLFRESTHASMLSSMQLRRDFPLESNAQQKAALIQMIQQAQSGTIDPKTPPIVLPRFFPKLLHVQSKVIDLFWRLYNGHASDFMPERDLYVRLSSLGAQNYWQFFEVCRSSVDEAPPLIACEDRKMDMTMFSDRAQTSQLLGNMSIIGIYTTFCLLVARLVRRMFIGNVFQIIYTDMPQVDAVLQLCFDIYLVRTSGDFALEEDLYAKLLFLHRSPETLIEITRLANRPAKLERWDIDLMETSEDRKIRDMRERLARSLPMFNQNT